MKMNRKVFWPILAISITANAFLAYNDISNRNGEIVNQTTYPLLSKRIFIQNPNDVLINFAPLRQSLKAYTKSLDGKVGIYFEYLPSGSSLGIHSEDEIMLASLSKIPLAMSIMKRVENGTMSLSDVITIKKEDLNSEFGDLWKQGAGAQFTVDELIRHSIQESDNTAYTALFNKLSVNEINSIYDNLDIDIRRVVYKDSIYPIVSPERYSSIFRSLYLSSYLSQKNSSYLLDILTETMFKDKIVAGLPNTIKVAHKIGTFKEVDDKEDVFIDCGIIYLPNRPYILCIFVKDPDEVKVDNYMSDISRIIYKYLTDVK